jgi:glyoxylase-like metal-dependent hydrolase (beta-lactamase superfamily II)
VEIVKGLHQLKVPVPNNPVGFTLPYVFEVAGGAAIIDPGWDAPQSEESLRAQLAELGLTLRDIRQIIVTHVHPDHYGLAAVVRQESGAQVLLHEKDVEFARQRASGLAQADIEAWFGAHGMPSVASGWMSGGRANRYMTFAEPDKTMSDGERLSLGSFQLKVMWTPGHSPGHACFYEEGLQLLLTGDHVLPTISPNVGLWPGSEADPLGDYISSLRRLRGLPVKRVLPAHEYDFADLDGRIDELERHHEDRLHEVLEAMQAGASTAYEVARGVRWSIGHFDGFDMMTRRAAMTETVAHLEHLLREGVISSTRANGIMHFQRTSATER